MKRILLSSIFISFSVLTVYFIYTNQKEDYRSDLKSGIKISEGMSNPAARLEWETKRLVDPATGKIPSGIRKKELAFAQHLPKEQTLNREATWESRGPYNIGGRTRGAAYDVEDEMHLIAGGASGGIWNSTDGGDSWIEVTQADQTIAITSIAQDTRPGKTNIWYAGSGEKRGSSASSPGSFDDYRGDGLLKSIDNGLTWDTLSSTYSGTPQTTESWDFVWKVITDPTAADSLDVVFAAISGAILRSADGGKNWDIVIGQGGTSGYYTDIVVSSSGVFYATMSSVSSIVSGSATNRGVFRSEDGINWNRIDQGSPWPSQYLRSVIAIAPGDENIVYFLNNSYDYSGNGKQTFNFNLDTEWNSVLKYEYLSGDGTGAGGSWTDLSQSLPTGPELFDDYISQTGYNMCIAVHPTDPNFVVFGGTNLYRTTDGFATTDNISKIGGYGIGTTLPLFEFYPNQHPDQHLVFFSNNDPNTVYVGCDGGFLKTNDIAKNIVEWESLNNGYITTQFYTVAIDHLTNGSNTIIGGLQDNGTLFTSSSNNKDPWEMTFSYDGAYCAVEDGGSLYYMSIQLGRMIKLTADNNGVLTSYQRIDPIGGNDYDFINPFILDPLDNTIMYLSEGEHLWRNEDLSQIPLNNEFDSISTNWTRLTDRSSGDISAFGPTETGSHTLYIGTSGGQIYKLDSAHTGDPTFVDIRNDISGNGYVSSIAVDPNNDDNVLVVFSNYKVHSLHFSSNGGQNWGRVGGNLEGESEIPSLPEFYHVSSAPSCRYAKIVPTNSGNVYLVGTSVGLFGATDLYPGDDRESDSTKWIQLGHETIGNAVVSMIDARSSDGFVVAATHGNGVFSSHITQQYQITGIKEKTTSDLVLYPNPATDHITVELELESEERLNVVIYDISGKRVSSSAIEALKGANSFKLDIAHLGTGHYLVKVNQKVRSFIISK